MIQKNRILNNIKDKKDNDIINQRRQNLKNIYNQIKKNIKTTFSNTKQKNKLNDVANKKLTENIIKKSDSNNINSVYNKKSEESRNNNKTKLDKNIDEEITDGENDIIFNKTEKDIKLLYNKNYSKKLFKEQIKPNFDIKIREKEKDLFNKKSNYYSNKEIKENRKNIIRNNFLFQNNKAISNKELKPSNESNIYKYSEYNDSKKKQNSLEKVPRLTINKKQIKKDDLLKPKNIFEKLNSARLSNIEIHKLNLNFNKEIKSELKTISNKNTSRISSQKLVDLKEKELNLGKIKKIKKQKIVKKKIKNGKKNHSMTMTNPNNMLFLNDKVKDQIEKENEKYGTINIYNYPIIRNKIPRNKHFIVDSADKENSENNIKNDLSNLNNTCFNFNDVKMNNSALNTNLNVTMNPKRNKKNTPNKYSYHNNSFNKLYNQENYYSKPVARLKKRIFDSPSDKQNDESVNNIDKNLYFDKNNIKENDSLEGNIKEINNTVIKDLYKVIKALNKIINTQRKIIEEYMMKEIELKKELDKEVKVSNEYKNIILKLMIYLKEEKEINILNERNKKRNIIENQLLKENKILKQLILLPNKDNNTLENDSEIKRISFYKNNHNENGSTINFYKANQQKNDESRIENGNNFLDPFLNLEIITNTNINKKREKSYENKKKKRIDEKL